MTHLVVYPENDPGTRLEDTRDPRRIAAALQRISVRFDQWPAGSALAPDASPEAIIEAYRRDVDRLMQEGGYVTVDVVRLAPDPADAAWPDKARAARQKFLDEHTHAEDEVRFFVEGSGVFYLRVGGKVHAVVCERGDLLSVPKGTRHWFDMGKAPQFCVIRLFTTAEGWVASFTGEPIARSFPDADALRERAA